MDDFWVRNLPAGWKVDVTKGDPGHAGASKVDDEPRDREDIQPRLDRPQAKDTQVRFTETVRAQPSLDAGGIHAIYDVIARSNSEVRAWA